jgi:hypothetical protein
LKIVAWRILKWSFVISGGRIRDTPGVALAISGYGLNWPAFPHVPPEPRRQSPPEFYLVPHRQIAELGMPGIEYIVLSGWHS